MKTAFALFVTDASAEIESRLLEIVTDCQESGALRPFHGRTPSKLGLVPDSSPMVLRQLGDRNLCGFRAADVDLAVLLERLQTLPWTDASRVRVVIRLAGSHEFQVRSLAGEPTPHDSVLCRAARLLLRDIGSYEWERRRRYTYREP